MLLVTTVAFASEPSVVAMHERYELLDAVRIAVVEGRLKEARAAAKRLSRGTTAGVSPEWAAHTEAVSRGARSVASSSDLIAAANGTAVLADTCGACHAASGGGPNRDQLAAIPAQGWTEGTNMKLHAWASDVMWFGLLTRDEGVWANGAGQLAAEPIPLKYPEPPLRGDAAQLELRLYVLAGRALELKTAEERTVLYGEMLATCAECHVQR